MKDSIWGKNFFNIPPGEDFAFSLIRGLEDRLCETTKRKPDRFADSVILLNNTRSLKRLENSFFEKGVTILPRLGLVTDISFLFNGSIKANKRIKVESRLEKLLSLEKLVFGYLTKLGHYVQKESSFDLTVSLERILRDLTLAGLEVEAFEKIDDVNLSNHRIQSLGFLKIIKEYQVYLNKHKILDKEGLNSLWLKLIEKQWRKCPPNSPVVIAGSTGSRHTTARLMKAVSKLPKGWVVLPGFDETMTDLCWWQIKPDHPQYSFKKLYNYISEGTDQIDKIKCPANWTEDCRTEEIRARAKLLSLAMLPSKRLHTWNERKKEFLGVFKRGLENVSILEVSNSRQEAENISLIIRMALEKKKSVSLVTPDVKIAKRVGQALNRWNIKPDNSFGLDPLQNSISRFIRLALDFQCLKFDLLNFLAILKHPLCLEKNRSKHLNFLREFEVKNLRGSHFEADIYKFRKAVLDEKNKNAFNKEYFLWLNWVSSLLNYKIRLIKKTNTYRLDIHVREFDALTLLLRGHSRMAGEESKSVSDGLKINGYINLESNSLSLQKIIEDIKLNASYSRKLNSASFRAFFLCILRDLHIPCDQINATENVYIWGTLESRTQKTDVCILSGLNEGIWPRQLSSDFWLNSKMRCDMGLQTQDNTVGLAAHDFQNAFLMSEVILSRSTFVDGSNKLPTRWLFRLQKLLSSVGAEGLKILNDLNNRGNYYGQILDGIQRKLCNEINLSFKNSSVGLRPCPIPPVKSRPTRVSISSFIRLINDPYEVYAQEILGLKKLDPLWVSFDSRAKGVFIHEIMRKFIERTKKIKPDLVQWSQDLIDIAFTEIEKNIKDSRVKVRLMEEIKNKANRIVASEIERRQKSIPIILEKTGEKKFSLLSGIDIVLTAKADRIDLTEDNKLIVLDYKSSKPTAHAFDLNMPQLDLEALLVDCGCFGKLRNSSDLEVGVIVLDTKISELRKSINRERLQQIEINFLNIMERIFSANWGYTARKSGVASYSGDYDHLARYGEWSITDKPYPIEIDGS